MPILRRGPAMRPTWVHTSWHLSYSSAMSLRWVDCAAGDGRALYRGEHKRQPAG